MIGDHIRARKDGRWNHAIDCGDLTVITLADDPSLPPADRVRRLYRPEFEAGAEAVEVVTHRERTFPPRQVVARAFSRTRDAALPAMFQDSEQFAAWCKIGRLGGARNVAVAVPGVALAGEGATATRNGAAAKSARSADGAAKPAAKAQVAKPALKAKPAAAKPAPAKKAKGVARPAKKTKVVVKAKAAKAAPKAAKQAAAKPKARGAKKASAKQPAKQATGRKAKAKAGRR